MITYLIWISFHTFLQEDGWVVCRVFKKKNLFKVGNEGGGSSMNSDQQTTNTLSINQPRASMHRENQYLITRLQPNHGNQPISFEPELALHQYSHNMPPSQYSLFQSHPLIPTHKPLAIGYDYSTGLPSDSPIMVKQLMSNPRDCESGSESLRYQACEPGLEVGTCEPTQQMVAGRDHDGMNVEWSMLDRLVTSHLGNEESSKGVRFEDTNTSSVHPMNQLSLRGEMDFWGYGK